MSHPQKDATAADD